MIVDCRKCRFFIPLRILEKYAATSPDEWGRALEVVEIMRAEGQTVMGWCRKRDGPVKYYTGRCRFYEPLMINQRRLTEFLSSRR